MRHGLDELRIGRIRFVPHLLDVVETFFVTTHINFQVLQMHFTLSFFGGRNSQMMVLPYFEHSSEGLFKTPNENAAPKICYQFQMKSVEHGCFRGNGSLNESA